MEQYFADRCTLIEMQIWDRLKGGRGGQRAREYKKKDYWLLKRSVSGAVVVLGTTASAAQCSISGERGRKVIVTLLFGWE